MAKNAAPVRQLSRISFKSPLKKAARKIVTAPTFNTIKTIDFDKKNEYVKFIKFIESSNKELLKVEIPTPDALKEDIKGSTQDSEEKGISPLAKFVSAILGFNLLNWLRKRITGWVGKWWKNSKLRKWILKNTYPLRKKITKIKVNWRNWKKGVTENIKNIRKNITNSIKQSFKKSLKFLDDITLKPLKEGIKKLKNFKLKDVLKHIKPPKFLTNFLSSAKNWGKNLWKGAGPALKNIRSKAGGILSKVNPFKKVKIPKVGGGGWMAALTLIPDALKVIEMCKEGRWKDASRFIIKTGVSFGVFSLIFGASGASAVLTTLLSGGTLGPAAIAVLIGGTAAATVGSGAASEGIDQWLKSIGLEDDKLRSEVKSELDNRSKEVKKEETAVTNKKEESDKELEMLLATPVKKENPVVASSKNITRSVASNNNSTKPVLNTNEKKEIRKDGIVDFKVASKSPVLEETGPITQNPSVVLIPPANHNVVKAASGPKILQVPGGGRSTPDINKPSADLNMAKINERLLEELQTLKLSVT